MAFVTTRWQFQHYTYRVRIPREKQTIQATYESVFCAGAKHEYRQVDLLPIAPSTCDARGGPAASF